MSQFIHHLSRKPNSLCKLFSRLPSFNHHQGANIEDDWECIEVLDRELSTGKEDEDATIDQHVEMGDQEDDKLLSFSSFQNENHVKMNYTIVSKDDVRRRLEDKITKVATVLLLPINEAAILLQHFKWSVNRTIEEWLASEEKVRKAVGLFAKSVVETPADAAEIGCGICLENLPRDLLFSVSCGHQICRSCWEGYINEAINDGPRCLTLRCPNPSCDAALGLYSIELLSSKDDKNKFENHFLRSYITDSRKAKWCPAPGCNYVVFSSNGGEGNVTCQCSHCFCWSCSEEAHAPVDCSTLTDWMSEGALQSENRKLAYTTPCPRCNFNEQIFGLYVKCTLCNFEFCSLCGGDCWSKKRSEICSLNEDYYVKEFARKSLVRYNHYYKEWEICISYRESALADLMLFQDMQLQVLCGIYSLSPKQLEFLVEALLQVVECWQLLKWTYVYGYFLPNDEHVKKRLFEFMQKEAVGLVKRLHKHVGEELQNFLFEDVPFARILEFRNRITKLTRVTRIYFDQLVKGLKDGLSEVVCIQKLSPRLKMSQE